MNDKLEKLKGLMSTKSSEFGYKPIKSDRDNFNGAGLWRKQTHRQNYHISPVQLIRAMH